METAHTPNATEKMLRLLELEGTPQGVAVAREAQELFTHPVLSMVRSIEDAQVFMGFHVWAVWDFMSLVKALQQAVTCTGVPWLPPKDANLAAFINEIVVGEESDVSPEGGHASHYELYLRAMDEVGADYAPIETFIGHLREGEDVGMALAVCGAPPAVQAFVKTTMSLATGPLHRCASAFCLSREEIIPGMFMTLLKDLGHQQGDFPTFRYYLQRHIEVDGDSHGPLSARLFEALVGQEPGQRQDALQAALSAIQARRQLFDAIQLAIASNRKTA